MLPLWFANPADYDLITGSDKLTIHDLASLAPNKPVKITGKRADGSEYEFEVNHTVSKERRQRECRQLLKSSSSVADFSSSMRDRSAGSELGLRSTS